MVFISIEFSVLLKGELVNSVPLMIIGGVCLFGFITIQILIGVNEHRVYKARVQRRLRELDDLGNLDDL
ncbi:MAG: hypothetical protein QF442_03040 [Candidatus Peribacteraceae bacterium]|jgi:hypothetical protein|nr:hypothetical protein [Candidatus Peribacteraceae bacterium]